jgi:serine protease Do
VIPQLEKHGHVARGWLGIEIQPVTKEIADSLGLKAAQGALVAEPQPGSPAAKAGLKSGDVIASVDGVMVKDPRDLARRIAALGPDEAVNLTVISAGNERTVNVKLGQLKDQQASNAAIEDEDHHGDQFGSLGLSVAPASEVEGAGSKGLAVVNVDPNSKAAELGFQEGDIILKAGDKTVSRPEDLTSAMAAAKAAGRKNALVLIKRDQTDRYVAVPVAVG